MRNSQKLILVHATNGSSSANVSNEDYDIWDDEGWVIGRVFRAANAPKDQPWFWVSTVRAARMLTSRGYAATREDALRAFRRAWREHKKSAVKKPI